MRLALLAFIWPLILLLLFNRGVLGRPKHDKYDINGDDDEDYTNTENNKKYKIATVSRDDEYYNDDRYLDGLDDEIKQKRRQFDTDYDEAKRKSDNEEDDYVYTNLSKDEIKLLSKKFFNRLQSEPKAEFYPQEKHHHSSSSNHKHRDHKLPISSSSENILPEIFNGKNINANHGCIASPFSQMVHHPGCESKYILNRFCHGTCSSVYIPELRSKKLKEIFQNYTVCRPIEIEHVQVKLECNNSYIIKEITRVKRCDCVQHDAPLPE